MPVTQSLNSKANVKKSTNQDVPFNQAQPVMSSFYATSTAGQTVINLSFSVDQTLTDQFFLFVDGKKLRLGSGNDYTFTSISSDNKSSQVTLTQALALNLNIQAYMLGLKNEVEFGTDNRFTQLYAAQNAGFQAFVDQTSFINTATATTGTPAAGTFYSSIVGRAPMVDLSQNLKAQMGIERITNQQIYQLQNEFGPNGEPVWATPNDLFGQIRFVGKWSNNNAADGLALYSNSATDFCEVTFYGTGLNLTGFFNSPTNITGTVDGSTAISNIVTFTGSSVIISRNYSSNQSVPVVSGLSLGVHTVKLIFTTTSGQQFSGFEILNESGLIKVSSGVGYSQGKKYTSSALQSFAYNAAATGTRGGRTVVYQNGDGTIGTAWQAVNASSATFASADHTNEEIVRAYFPREFGANRSDDFSGLNAGASNSIFTLDDGTTTLVGSSVIIQSAGLTGVADSLAPSTTNSFVTFTFVGTGVDIMSGNAGAIDSHTVYVDGTSIGSLTGSTPEGKIKIVSGLPYGTHTVKILRTASSNAAVWITYFIVYQPKKPSIPSGVVELADYNVMADFAVGSVGVLNVSTGVLRKSNTREIIYVNGTGGSNNWNIGADVDNEASGFSITSDRTNAYAEYTFFGTGVDFRYFAAGNRSSSIQVSLQNLTAGGSLSNATTANFGTATFSQYGVGSFNSSTGILNQNGSNTGGSGLRISGLPLALYKIRVLNNTASSFLSVTNFDIITPIHSVKSNVYADLQNTLSVGSQGISDNRKLTPVKNVLPIQKAWVQAVGKQSSPTSTATFAVPMPDMSLTIKTNGQPLEISYSASLNNSTAGVYIYTRVYVDGVPVGTIQYTTSSPSGGGYVYINADSVFVPVSAGTHKVDLYWYTSSGTITARELSRILKAKEI